jgi:cytochrome c5
MSRPNLLVLPLIAATFVVGSRPVAAAAEEGEKVFQESCTKCHNAKEHPLDAIHLSRKDWKDAVERMEGMGTEVPHGKKLDALLDWLERTHGPAGGASTPEKK